MKFHLLAVTLVIVVGTLAYSNSFKNPFFLDSVGQIEYRGAVHSLSRLGELWYHDPSRFVPFFTFALNYHFGRYEVFGYHVVNLLIHLTNALLVYWLVLTTLRLAPALSSQPSAPDPLSLAPWGWALVAGLVFVAHPLQTQAVTYIVQRMESLAALFYLLTLCLYLKARLLLTSAPTTDSLPRSGWFWVYYGGALCSFVLGCMSKEIMVTAPVLLMLYEWLFLVPRTSADRLSIKFLVPFFVLALIPFILVGMKPGSLAQDHVQATRLGIGGIFFGDWDYWGRYVLTQGRVLWTYVRLVFLPIEQNLDYDYPVAASLFDPSFLMAWLAWVVLAIGVGVLFRHHRLVLLGGVWFFLTLSVTSLVPLGMVIFEHRMYLPLVGIVLVLVGMLGSLPSVGQKVCQGVVLFLLVPSLIFATYSRNEVWGNAERFWRDVIAKSLNKGRGYTHLGAVLGQQGNFEGALDLYLKVVALQPQFFTGHLNAGETLFKIGDVKGALTYAYRALELAPNVALVHLLLADCLENLGETQQADAHLHKAIELNSEDAALYNRAGNFLWRRRDARGALRLYQKAVALDPGYAEAGNNLANALRNLGHHAKAIMHYQRSIEIQPDYTVGHLNLASILYEQKEFSSAIIHYRRALELDPALVPAYQGLGSALLSHSREEAAKVYRNLLSISPGNPLAIQALRQLGVGSVSQNVETR